MSEYVDGQQVIGVGNQLISAVLQEDSVDSFNMINTLWLNEPEKEMYDAVKNHYDKFGRLPTADTMYIDMGFDLDVSGGLDSSKYYLDEIANRYLYLAASDFQNELSETLLTRDMDKYMSVIERMRTELGESGAISGVETIKTVASSFMLDLERDMHTGGLRGITSGYDKIDESTGGLMPGDLGFIAGRMKMGKTFILLHTVISAWLAGHTILFVSMEMSAKQIVSRIMGMMSRIDMSLLRKAGLSTWSYEDMLDTLKGYDDLPPFHFMSGNFRKNVSDIRNIIFKVKPDLVAIDGAYLLGTEDRARGTAKHELLSTVAGEMKAVAEDASVAMRATVQLNRGASASAKSSSADIDMEHIAGSDAFGQAATEVWGVSAIRNHPDKRRLKEIVARDAPGDVDMVINSTFNPADFTYSCNYDPDDFGDDVAEKSVRRSIDPKLIRAQL